MKCNLCGEHDVSPETLMEDIRLMVDHIRVMHPDFYSQLELWLDGEPVIHDETVEPEDFE